MERDGENNGKLPSSFLNIIRVFDEFCPLDKLFDACRSVDG